MKRVELQIEHSYKNRFVSRYRVGSDVGLMTLGSAREAHIRLLGDNVGGVHAALEWSDGSWVLSDLGSEHGTWVQKRPVIQHEITESTLIQIGNHQMKLTPVTMNLELFHRDVTVGLNRRGELFHQAVVRRNHLLLENSLMAGEEPFVFDYRGEKQTLMAPPSESWVITRFNDLEVRQRLVRSEVLNQTGKNQVLELMDSNIRGPLTIASVVVLIFTAFMFLLPQAPKDKMANLQPQELNRYTRMIYDAKKVKQQRAESQRRSQEMVAQLPEKEEATNPAPKAATATGTRVVNNLKSSNLKALIGKISARAAKNTTFIQSAGMAPDVTGTGVALSGGRSIASEAGAMGADTGKTKKIGNIGTLGKGGGATDYKGVGGLAIGSVGSASVGVLDEETEVEGGLDKDLIARYIKSQLGQIRYCYERQLSASPDLYGKVLVKFTIGSSGSVITQSIGTTSLNNAMVEGCILRRVAGWQFPAPMGGTHVLVSYPFLFKSTR